MLPKAFLGVGVVAVMCHLAIAPGAEWRHSPAEDTFRCEFEIVCVFLKDGKQNVLLRKVY